MNDAAWVEAEFERCRPFLERAARRVPDGPGLDEIRGRIIGQKAQLWPGIRSAVVTQVMNDGRLHIWLAGGVLAETLDLERHITAFASGRGLKSMSIHGRIGWARALPDYRIDERNGRTAVMVKEL